LLDGGAGGDLFTGGKLLKGLSLRNFESTSLCAQQASTYGLHDPQKGWTGRDDSCRSKHRLPF